MFWVLEIGAIAAQSGALAWWWHPLAGVTLAVTYILLTVNTRG